MILEPVYSRSVVPVAWLIRHAESTANEGQPTKEPALTPLSVNGKRQAAEFELPGRPSLIVVSGFIRTHETAAPTIARYPDIPVEVWPVHEFTYLNCAKYDGTTEAQRQPMAQAYFDRDDPSYRDDGVAESFLDLQQRVAQFMERLEEGPTPIAVFTHGRFIQACHWFYRRYSTSPKSFYAWAAHNPIANLSITTLSRQLVPRATTLSFPPYVQKDLP